MSDEPEKAMKAMEEEVKNAMQDPSYWDNPNHSPEDGPNHDPEDNWEDGPEDGPEGNIDPFAFKGKKEALLCECHQLFDPLNQVRWAPATTEMALRGRCTPDLDTYPDCLTDCQYSQTDGILMHAFFRMITVVAAQEMPDFRPLHLLRELEQEMLSDYIMEVGTLTDTLYYCNVGFDVLPQALKPYELTHKETVCQLHLILIALPCFFCNQVKYDLRNQLLDDLTFVDEPNTQDYIACPGLVKLVPDFLKEMSRIVDEIYRNIPSEEAQ